MPIRVACPSCKTPCAIPDELRGKKVFCASCKKPFLVPAPTPPAAEVPPPAQKPAGTSTTRPAAQSPPAPARREPATDGVKPAPRQRPTHPAPAEAEDRPRPRKRAAAEGGKTGLLVAGVVTGLVVLAGGAVGAILIFGPKGEDQVAQAKELPPQAEVKLDVPVAAAVKVENPAPKGEDPPARAESPPPKVQSPPARVDPPAGEPVPAQIAVDAVRKVKKATAYLRVNLPGGGVAEGTGFFGAEPGIVFTNAHVLGMLQADSIPPVKVEVVLNSGEPDEARRAGNVLGVDRASDLAVLRVDGDPAGLPAPLMIDSAQGLVETQKVYIFGFPFGAQLGKNITVSESSVTSLRRDPSGALTQVQVNGGMHPGNSGGPVTDTRGVVVGVSVAIIRGTQINFAVPGDFVRRILDGRHAATELGIPYLDKGQARMPVKLACLDPLDRIREVRLEIWTGTPGRGRPASLQAPEVGPGDGPRQSFAVSYARGAGTVEIPLPQAEAGKVVWLQPILKTASGATQWAAASAYRPGQEAPLERRPALLQFKCPAAAAERTLKVKSTFQFKASKGDESFASVDDVEYDILETIRPEPRGAEVTIAFGGCRAKTEEAGKRFLRQPLALQMLRQFTARFILEPTGKFKLLTVSRAKAKDPRVEDDLYELYSRACNSYQSTCLPLPGRSLSPQETWNARPIMFLGEKGAKKKKIVDLALTCTYEGVRGQGGSGEAYIRLAGDVKERGAAGRVIGKADGFALFHLEGGYLSQVRVNVTSEGGGGAVSVRMAFETTLTRTPGNILNIPRPTGGFGQVAGSRPAPGPGPKPGPAGNQDAKQVLQKMQGVWKMAKFEVNGLPRPEAERFSVSIQGDRFAFIRDGKDRVSSAVLAPGPAPGAVNITWTEGPSRGLTSLAVYRFTEDGGLEICWNQARGKGSTTRPSAFTTGPAAGSGSVLYVLKR